MFSIVRPVSAAVMVTALPAGLAAEPIKLEFGSFHGMEMVEQDVFVEAGMDKVRRIGSAEVPDMMDAALYGSSEIPPFTPLTQPGDETHPKGAELGMTLGTWLSAQGSGTYDCVDGKSVIDLQFTGLVPNGLYTMWNFIDAVPPTDPWQTILFPLGARDGSQSEFTADADGNADYSVTFEPCLELTGTQTMTGLAAAWHQDGKTYGTGPGDLGVVTFTQLMTALMP